MVAVQPGCTLVVQRSFPVWLEYIIGVLFSFFVAGGAVASWWVLPLMNKHHNRFLTL